MKKCYKCGTAESSHAGLCARCAANRVTWESYILPEGERTPTGNRANLGWNWVWKVFVFAALITATAILGMMAGDDFDREHEFRSRLIRREVR